MQNAKKNLDLFLDDSDQLYKDIFQNIDDDSSFIYSDHIGYPNLFPYFFGYANQESL